MGDPKRFSELLYQGIQSVRSHESSHKRKLVKDIHAELALAIGRRPTTIEHYLRRNIPTTSNELETLARTIFTRGNLNKEWLEDFLDSGGHHSVTETLNEIARASNPTRMNSDEYPFRRRKLECLYELFPDRSRLSRTSIELEATSDLEVESVRHRNIADIADEFDGLELDFEPGMRSSEGSLDNRIVRKDSNILIWIVEFSPPLKRGEVVSYSYSHKKLKTLNWTREDCDILFNSGLSNKKVAAWRYTITAPTEEFEASVKFPSNYPIALPPSGGFCAYIGMAEELQEKTRLIAENAFSAHYDAAQDRWELNLKVSNCRVGMGYELQWIPPSLSQIS